MAKLLWLTLAAFAIGTETYMIAGLLPGIAADLTVTVGEAGQLVTAFALAYAFGAPLLAVATANFDRRALLTSSIALFAVLNGLAVLATSYALLMVIRMGMALAAGLFMPAAIAVAGVVAGPERRGRAVAMVSGGVTLAIALGSPVGTLIGGAEGWRAPFLGVAGLSAAAAMGVGLGLGSTRDLNVVVPPLRERLGVLAIPAVRRLYGVCALYALSGLMIYTYLAALTAAVTGMSGSVVGLMQALWGIGAAVGIFGGGFLVDRLGAGRVGLWMLALQVPGYAALSLLAWLGPHATFVVPLAVAIAAWGLPSWAYWPAHQARLMAAAPSLAAITLSLNQAVMYLGISAGAFLGAEILEHAPNPAAAHLGWVAATITIVAVTVFARASAAEAPRAVETPAPSGQRRQGEPS